MFKFLLTICMVFISSTVCFADGDSELNDLISKLTKETKVESDSLLDNLAKEVDALKKKIVVERASLLATQSPKNVKVLGSKTIFNYSDGGLYEITSATDHVTDIQLKSGESLKTTPTAGDVVRWNIGIMTSGKAPNEVTHLIIKPLEENIETNLIVTTDEHVYQLRLKSGSFHTPSVSWNYPEDFDAKLKDAIKKEESEELTVNPSKLNHPYKVEGDYDWKPISVFDDGSKTFIQMPSTLRVSEKPLLFILNEDDESMLVNYRVKGDLYIVDRLFKEAELRIGTDNKISIRFDDGKNWLERLFS